MKYLTLLFVLASSAMLQAQSPASYHVQLIDAQTEATIAYAHIAQKDHLVAITDYFGMAVLVTDDRETPFKISCVGYKDFVFDLSVFQIGKKKVLKLSPDEKILNSVVITPTSLKDMIAEVYDNIPKAYLSKPHLLSGQLEERYMDTLSHSNISTYADVSIQKESYLKARDKGDVRIDSLARSYQVKDKLSYQIVGGAHIPHRFDFVMKREEFINPASFDKYEYTYLGEIEYGSRKVDVIRFEPRSKGLMGGQYRGKIYIDMKEKVFVKGEYQYTKSGLFSNTGSNWADQRMFITEYTDSDRGWYFSYTWDEAVRRENKFLLSQRYKTDEISFDTLSDWNYQEKVHLQDALEEEVADTIMVEKGTNISSLGQALDRKRKLIQLIKKLEIGFGLRLTTLERHQLTGRGRVDFGNEQIVLNNNYNIKKLDVTLSTSFKYKLNDKYAIQFVQTENLSDREKIKNWEIKLARAFSLNTLRPSQINFTLGYVELLSRLRFEKQAGYRPYYERRYKGLISGLSYEVRINPRWKIGFGYSYFHKMTSKERFYLQENYGLLDLFTKKHEYSTGNLNWEVDNAVTNDEIDLFDRHLIDVSIIMSWE